MAKKNKMRTISNRLNVDEARNRRKQALYVMFIILFVMVVYFGFVVGNIMEIYPKKTGFFSVMIEAVSLCREDPSLLIPTHIGIHTLTSCLWLVGIWAFVCAFLWVDDVRHQTDLNGIEQGSAKLNSNYKGFDEQFSDKDKLQTTYLSRNVALAMNTRQTLRNNNVLIIGGSGAGKTRFFVKPNILQLNSNMVITDPSGELLESTGTFLKEEGYSVKIFNLVEMHKSNCYNPFHYIRDDQGVIMMINCLIKNTTPPEAHTGDPFWEKSETALLQALVFYLKTHRPVEEQNFSTVMELLRWAEVDERNPDYESKLDRIFLKSKQKSKRATATMNGSIVSTASPEETEFNKYMSKTTYTDASGAVQRNIEFKSLEELDVDGTDIAVKQYKIFKMGAGKTAKSILISCAVRLTVFNLPQLAQLTNTDDIHLEDLGGTNPNKKKQALFVIIPAADSTFNFLVSMMYSQLFETLYFVAETDPRCNKKRLPRHVKFLLDEFANIGTIPEFTKKLATMRKYEISCSVILQNLAQIKTMYKDDWESIVGNCDSMVFLGGKEFTTLEYISKQLGEQTIIQKSRGMSHGKQKSDSQNYQTLKRPLMTPDELGNMDNARCVVQVRGIDPFLDYKFDYLKHVHYDRTSDANPELSYENPLNNMLQKNIDVEAAAVDIVDSQAKAISRICSLEEMIANNPNWNDYPTIFSAFKTVPAAQDEADELDDAIQAIATNPVIDPPEIQPQDVGTQTISALVRDYQSSGQKPSQNPVLKEAPKKNFFDDQEDE